MDGVPKSLRLQIALFGRANCGKSTLINKISGQDVSIVSPQPGTTTDVVEKTMELHPLGPAVFLDTAGFDDDSPLGALRIERTRKIFQRADVAILVTSPGIWGASEKEIVVAAKEHKIPIIVIINKCDEVPPSPDFSTLIRAEGISQIIPVSALYDNRDAILSALKAALLEVVPDDFLQNPPLLRNFITPGSLVVLIVPIDIQAPRGRLILPQVQAIRDALDGDSAVIVVKESQYAETLKKLNVSPDLVVCDSQVVDFMVANTPPEIPCTTFSILLAAAKGDIAILASGAEKIDQLQDGDRILIAEACTHHATSDDIGRVKIPRLIRQKTGKNLAFDVFSGHDFPENLTDYALVIQCGGCMIGRREILSRLQTAQKYHVPITNYGMAISACRGVLPRVMSVFKK
ncbi:MAG: [FeFe] hydrogenase H-cluster maturation GTPase HydF [Victivallaceae bacterium]|nr:[FeFe] hydrogenase H-cluster maturation GTPase HydF [Victivallaceae bacterium]